MKLVSGIKAPAMILGAYALAASFALLFPATVVYADIPLTKTIGIFGKAQPKPCDPAKVKNEHYDGGDFKLLLTTCTDTGVNVKTHALSFACRDNDDGRWDLVATPADVKTIKKVEGQR